MNKVITENKKAKNIYQILEKFEAGISLKGFEVKAIKKGKISISGSYVMPKGEELFLVGATVSPYQPLNTPKDYKKDRDRKLLLHKKEIKSLLGKMKQKGLTLVPTKVYTKDGKIKVEIALAKGKKKFEKREALKKKAIEREIQRFIKRV